MTSADAIAAKRAMRARMRAARDAFVAGGPAPIAPPAAFLARLRPGIVVASYRAIGSEADPARFDRAARAAGAVLSLPRVTTRDQPMRFLRWDDRTPLERGPLGLEQPPEGAPQVGPALILTPLLAFDRAGNRLGQGAGYYDRAFAACPDAWRLGLAWSVQEVDRLVADAWDVPLHSITTEREAIAIERKDTAP